MNESHPSLGEIASATRRVAARAADIGANRLEILVVEAQEARERLLQIFLLASGTMVFGLLTGIALSAAIVFVVWPFSAAITLGVLALLYAAAGVFLYSRLNKLRCEWQVFSDSVDQLRKDCECLADTLR